MKEVDAKDLVSAIPVAKPMLVPLTRKEKLLRWANLIRESDFTHIHLYHLLEENTPEDLARARINGAAEHADVFHIAAGDPVFNADGLPKQTNIAEIMGYFDLTQMQLHAFSCDCGGVLSKDTIATRIENFANGPIPTVQPMPRMIDSASWTGRFASMFGG